MAKIKHSEIVQTIADSLEHKDAGKNLDNNTRIQLANSFLSLGTDIERTKYIDDRCKTIRHQSIEHKYNTKPKRI